MILCIRSLPNENNHASTKNLVPPRIRNTDTTLQYRLYPSTAIQTNDDSKKNWIAPAMILQVVVDKPIDLSTPKRNSNKRMVIDEHNEMRIRE